MKVNSKVVAAVALAIGCAAGMARADEPAVAAKPMDAVMLGRVDAILTLCDKADASNRALYRRLRTELVVFGEGTKFEMRAPGADTPEYKAAYAEMLEAARQQPEAELVASCHASFAADTKPAG